jgi:hypothetical protein
MIKKSLPGATETALERRWIMKLEELPSGLVPQIDRCVTLIKHLLSSFTVLTSK